MSLLSGTFCWNVGSQLTAKFTTVEGNVASGAAIYTATDGTKTTVDLGGGGCSINSELGFHFVAPAGNASFWMDGNVSADGKSGNAKYSIALPSGTVYHPPIDKSKPPQWLEITSC